MRLQKRHAWGAVLIALFALPVLRPQGIGLVEDPVAHVVTWSARSPALNPQQWKSDGDPEARGARVEALEQELARVWEQHLQLVQRVKDAKALRTALDTASLDRMPKVTVARVLMARDAVASRRSITIDRGAADGLAVGQPVVMGRVYLGKIRVVRSHSAIVQLVTDSRSRLEVFVRTDKDKLLRGWARLQGRRDGEDRLQVEFLHIDDGVGEVKVGAPVFTSNFSAQVPAHLLVGRISEVSDPDLDRMPTLTLRPALDLDRATDVFVLRTASPTSD